MNKKNKTVIWEKAPDIYKKTNLLIKRLDLNWLDSNNIKFIRSHNSKARAYARIWGLSRIWQLAINKKPTYIIEVISEKFDSLNDRKKDEVLLHELTHIPRNFSGSLIPHIRKKGKRNFNDKVNNLINLYKKLYKKTI